MNIGIVAQRDNSRAAGLAERIQADVSVEMLVDEATADALDIDGVPVEHMADADLVVSIGGDGTFLFAARGVAPAPIMGVNLGEVGFLNAVPPEAAVDTVVAEIEHIRETGSPRVRELHRIQADGDGWTFDPAMNEIAVVGPKRGHGRRIGTEVRIDGHLYTGGRADGVLVATPTGSTAYNMSEGGPLVHPDVEGLVVTGMVATEPMPPLVVAPDATVTVGVEAADRALVVADGHAIQPIEPPTQVHLRRADEPLRVAGPPLDFFTALGKLD